jgi:hypothetical protein
MRIVETKVYQFEELSDKAKEKALDAVRDEYYKYNDFADWAIDDCSLFEPPHKELEDMFGADYNFPLIKNTRGRVFFSADRSRYLQCANAMVITNHTQFLTWLGISEKLIEDIQYSIYTPNFYRDMDTTISFSDYPEEFEDEVAEAKKKFDNHIQETLKRIEEDIDYRFSDESIKEEITDTNRWEFTEEGDIF